MGEILFLAHRLPYPPDRGDRIRSWHILRALARIAPVHVAALVDNEADLRYLSVVESVSASVTVERNPSKLKAIGAALLRGTPASVEAFRNDALRAKVNALLAARPITCIYAFSGQMAAYVPASYRGRFIMDFVDMDSAKFDQMGGFANRQEARRLLKWEVAAANRANVSLFVSDAEVALFKARTGLLAQALGNGIDFARFDPETIEPVAKKGSLVVFTGQMDYAPNVAAATGFAQDVMPQVIAEVPDAKFAIVGRAPPAKVRALANGSVIVTGEVPDTRPWLAAADVVVAPLHLARGVQNKILEAMAMARPVVASVAAATGIDAIAERDLIVADNPVADVIDLLKDPARAALLGAAARNRMIDRYGWDAQLAPLAGLVTG